MNSKATKNDAGKPDLAIIPYTALVACAEALMVGEKKYSRYNYLQGDLKATRIASAALRHIYAWLAGESHCPVDGQQHLGSVLACVSMLVDLEARGKLRDDRYKGEQG